MTADAADHSAPPVPPALPGAGTGPGEASVAAASGEPAAPAAEEASASEPVAPAGVETVARYASSTELVEAVAERLLERLETLRADPEKVVQLCLTGGRTATRVYTALTERLDASTLDTQRLELWWSDERFVATEDPDRHAGHVLAILAGKLSMRSDLTHPMPAADGLADSAAAAASYGKELGETGFDICLLGMGPDGHVASVFPDHPSFEAAGHPVIGVTDSPFPPSERISLTVPTLNRSAEVWFLVTGDEKADAVRRSVAGDPTVPAGVVRGSVHTWWFLDRPAASALPYHSCSF
ncbi:6-phosphogluconolactonase [Propioniciclava soli]|uniref:6-phosphogluconolactonase n=1 Tax=Propioniciclava soli TaxID=2775081 RepID=UPI001E47F757|nr:6-phosphogluconolactonase [Propioniciclava soli]